MWLYSLQATRVYFKPKWCLSHKAFVDDCTLSKCKKHSTMWVPCKASMGRSSSQSAFLHKLVEGAIVLGLKVQRRAVITSCMQSD